MQITLSYSDSDKIKFLAKLGYISEKIEYSSFTGSTPTTKSFETKHSIIIVYKGKPSTLLNKLILKKYKEAKDFEVYHNELLHSAFDKEFSKRLMDLCLI